MGREFTDEERRLLEEQIERKLLEKDETVLSPIICWRCKEKNGLLCKVLRQMWC